MFFVNSKICNGCGTCLEVCPNSAINLQYNLAFIDQDLCQGCAACVEVCPQGAILTKEATVVEHDIGDLIPENAMQISTVSDQSRSISWRNAVVSTLLWTGREIAPRLANLVVELLEQLVRSVPTIQERQSYLISDRFSGNRDSTGRRRRQRRRQRQFR